jgi:hypothetical protein
MSLQMLIADTGPLQNSPLDQKREAVFELTDMSDRMCPVKTLILQQKFDGVEVYVSKFKKTPADRTYYEWRSKKGRTRMDMPHYCLARIEDITVNLRAYVKRNRDEQLAELAESHPINALVVSAAIKQSRPNMVCSNWHLPFTNANQVP